MVVKSLIHGLLLLLLATDVHSAQPFGGSSAQKPFVDTELSQQTLISDSTKTYVQGLIKRWNSTGISVAVVRRDSSQENGWKIEFDSHGIAREDGTPMTPDTVFAIASNSKLFLSLSLGLLISNETLAQQRGQTIGWTTKIRDLIPEWALLDEDMGRGVTIQDMLSHRTGMPRHDFSGAPRKGGLREMISTLRYLRPSAEFRETFQYNNLMYETLAHLPQVLLNQSYESYVSQHLFTPLNMTSSTLYVAEAERSGNMAHGFQYDMRDLTRGINGTMRATVPYFARPGEETIWAGAGGVLTSARDLATWVAMLLNNGRHPFTNATVVPQEVVEHVAYGRSVIRGDPEYPEMSAQVYGAGQWRFSYQGHDIIEHGGNNPGFKTQVARLPDDNLGIICLTNEERGNFLMEATKFRIIDDILGLKYIDWNSRHEKVWSDYTEKQKKTTARPNPPRLPSLPFASLATKTFSHPTYGTLKPCLVPQSLSRTAGDRNKPQLPHTNSDCASLIASYPAQRILSASDLTTPTYLISWKRSFVSHLRLSHFSGNLFNVTVMWNNAQVRSDEGFGKEGSGGDILIGLDQNFEIEWVSGKEEGLAFKGGFWGMEGKEAKSPTGEGKKSAEVWFAKND